MCAYYRTGTERRQWERSSLFRTAAGRCQHEITAIACNATAKLSGRKGVKARDVDEPVKRAGVAVLPARRFTVGY